MNEKEFSLVSKSRNTTKIVLMASLLSVGIAFSWIGAMYLWMSSIIGTFSGMSISLLVLGVLSFVAAFIVGIVVKPQLSLAFKGVEVTIFEKKVTATMSLDNLTKFQISREKITHGGYAGGGMVGGFAANSQRASGGEIELYFGAELYTVYVHNLNEVKRYILKFTGIEPTVAI